MQRRKKFSTLKFKVKVNFAGSLRASPSSRRYRICDSHRQTFVSVFFSSMVFFNGVGCWQRGKISRGGEIGGSDEFASREGTLRK